MNEKYLQDTLTEILYGVVNGVPARAELRKGLTPDVIAAVYQLAGRHSLAHLVSRYVFENRIEVTPEVGAKFQQADILRVYRHERMKYAFRQICEAFEEAQIAHIPLKGSVLRAFYPEESMRTSCDIDVLVREAELERAVGVLEQKGFRCGERHYHDISLYAPNGTHLELHFSIRENMDRLDAVLKDAWEYAQAEQGSRYGFRKDFFVFHMYAHMAYHFLSGGCGIRSLLDIWIMEHRMDAAYPCAEKLLKKAGIYRFAVEMSRIANRFFTQHDSSDPVMAYIWRGGVYGSRKNRISVQKKQLGSSRAYIWKRLLLPYRAMTIRYPVLKRAPVLLPFCWVHRWVRAILRGKAGDFASELACTGRVSDEDVQEVTEICMRLGLE